jgi:D-xylose transport system ATP-binding protein
MTTSTPDLSSADTSPPTPEQALLEAQSLYKSFGAVRALEGASIQVRYGQVHALVGDNGAGKSTFVRCLTGVQAADRGDIRFQNEPLVLTSPNDARKRGIETVYQNLALIEELTVWQNLYLDREITRFGFLDRNQMKNKSQDILKRLDVNVPSIHAKVQRMSGGQRQCIAIARSVNWGSNLVIMDEPTAALGVRETAAVEKVIRNLRDDGIAVLLITHDMDQVLRCADRVTVMRRGKDVTTRAVSQVAPDELVGLITGAIRPDDREQ